ncbi:NAD(P)-dependent oxidoreductase [Lichenicoccus roseus]|uniref:NAD(P)-dependent oxidoreductase n=1 Tax=Lichenicoccus roseus TaxID=2683649 RepID=A0A5R9JCT3_9PROT|nr:NAD(P)-dependent oxidoreductase [Lichenicoccus roseus]TLU74573.1 NAD(P)-dependent oxidoreductase [Lichenicoccus roseus]
MRLGFVGLGQMGRPIAHNLLCEGETLTVCSRSGRGLDSFSARGAAVTRRPADLSDAGIVFLCVPDAEAVRSVLFGADGLASCLAPGTLLVDLGTTDHAETLALGEAVRARDICFLDAPVSGMEARAIDGTLTVMCGGTPDAFARAQPLLARIGRTILHMGPSGSGQAAKLVNQLLFDINAAALAELLPFAARLGLDPAKLGEAVNSGTGRSHASEFFIPRILRGHFTDGYPMAAAYKDLVAGASLSARLGVPLPVLAAATATYQTALRRGHGGQDKGAMIRVFEDLLDVRFRAALPDG